MVICIAAGMVMGVVGRGGGRKGGAYEHLRCYWNGRGRGRGRGGGHRGGAHGCLHYCWKGRGLGCGRGGGRGSSCLELNLDDVDRATFSSMRLALSGVEFDDFDHAAFSPMRLELSGVEFGRF